MKSEARKIFGANAQAMVDAGLATRESLAGSRIWIDGRQVFGPPEDLGFWCTYDGERMRKRGHFPDK